MERFWRMQFHRKLFQRRQVLSPVRRAGRERPVRHLVEEHGYLVVPAERLVQVREHRHRSAT